MIEKMQQYHRRNLIIVLIVIVGAAVFFNLPGGAAPAYEIVDNRFILRGPEDFEVQFLLDEVESLTLLDSFTPETCVSGGTAGNCSYGIWENAELGQYQLCILTNLKTCMAATSSNGTLTIFNFENRQMTEEFYTWLYDYLNMSETP